MQVITTRYVHPTATKGSRMIASTGQGKSTKAYDHALDTHANHHIAARTLIDKLEKEFGGWSGEWVAGESVSGEVYWCNATWTTNRVVVRTYNRSK